MAPKPFLAENLPALDPRTLRTGVPAPFGWGQGRARRRPHAPSTAVALLTILISGSDPLCPSPHPSRPPSEPQHPAQCSVDRCPVVPVRGRQETVSLGPIQLLPVPILGDGPHTAQGGQAADGDRARESRLWRGDPTDAKGKFLTQLHQPHQPVNVAQATTGRGSSHLTPAHAQASPSLRCCPVLPCPAHQPLRPRSDSWVFFFLASGWPRARLG